MRRAAARSGEWAQHFSNASCLRKKSIATTAANNQHPASE